MAIKTKITVDDKEFKQGLKDAENQSKKTGQKMRQNLEDAGKGLNAVAKGGGKTAGIFKNLTEAVKGLLSPIGLAMAALGLLIELGKKWWDQTHLSAEELKILSQNEIEYTKRRTDEQKKSADETANYLNRLNELSNAEVKSNAVRVEALFILDKLTSKYGDLGITIDDVLSKNEKFIKVQSKLTAEEQVKGLRSKEKELKASTSNLFRKIVNTYSFGKNKFDVNDFYYGNNPLDVPSPSENRRMPVEPGGFGDFGFQPNYTPLPKSHEERYKELSQKDKELYDRFKHFADILNNIRFSNPKSIDDAIEVLEYLTTINPGSPMTEEDIKKWKDILDLLLDAKTKLNEVQHYADSIVLDPQKAFDNGLAAEIDKKFSDVKFKNAFSKLDQASKIDTLSSLEDDYNIEREEIYKKGIELSKLRIASKKKLLEIIETPDFDSKIKTDDKFALEYFSLVREFENYSTEIDEINKRILDIELKRLDVVKQRTDLEEKRDRGISNYLQNLGINLQTNAALKLTNQEEEALVQKAFRDAKAAKGEELTDDEEKQIRKIISLQHKLDKFKNPESEFGKFNVNDITRRGGFRTGAPILNRENINREILFSSKQQNDLTKQIIVVLKEMRIL